MNNFSISIGLVTCEILSGTFPTNEHRFIGRFKWWKAELTTCFRRFWSCLCWWCSQAVLLILWGDVSGTSSWSSSYRVVRDGRCIVKTGAGVGQAGGGKEFVSRPLHRHISYNGLPCSTYNAWLTCSLLLHLQCTTHLLPLAPHGAIARPRLIPDSLVSSGVKRGKDVRVVRRY